MEKDNAKTTVTVIQSDGTEVCFVPHEDVFPLYYPLDEFHARYTLPEESAFIQQQWYMKDGTYLWVHTRVDFPDECTVLCLKFEGDDGHYTMEFLNIDVFRTLVDSYTMCTQVTQVPYPNRVAKNNFEPRKSVNTEQKTGLRF